MSGLFPGAVPGTAADAAQSLPPRASYENGFGSGIGGSGGGAAGGAGVPAGMSARAVRAGPTDLSLLDDGAGGLVNGLDMDMSLPMDLDLDMSQVGTDAGFAPLAPPPPPPPAPRTTSSERGPGPGPGHSEAPPTSSTPMPDAIMSGAGAGPLPTGFGMPAPQNASTLTEFTKRRNWSQRVIEELKDFLHILSPDGRIMYVSPSCRAITGHEPNALMGKFIAEFVHPDDSGIFMREFNESIATGNCLRFFYRFKKDDGTYMIFECDGHPHISPEPPVPGPGFNQGPMVANGQPMTALCRGFFMMARPYPTKNAALLDSFLEHKIENERLMKRIEELKREEVEENAEQDRLYQEQSTPHAGATPSESQATRAAGHSIPDAISTAAPNYQGMPPPAKPTISNTALTRQNLDSALSAQKPDSIADKMSRYEASSTHLESIELLTGLRYRDGERSHGISTGDTSPALIRGDAGIAILLDRDRESKKEKKKLKVADEYVCADCGTLDSPEWRKGPKGPKTLCNACGLRWAKKEKKRTGDEVKTSSPGPMQTGAAGNVHLQQLPGEIPQLPTIPMHNSSGGS